MNKLFIKKIKKLRVTCYVLRVAGFSLIELVVVVAILGGLSIAISRMFFSQIGGSRKAQALIQLRQSGDHALLVIKRKIKGAKEIANSETYCDGSSKNSIEVISRDPSITGFASTKTISTTFRCEASGAVNRIRVIEVSDSGTTNTYITPDSLNVVDTITTPTCSNIFSCEKAVRSPAKVTINFDLEQPDTLESYNFSSTVILRNY